MVSYKYVDVEQCKFVRCLLVWNILNVVLMGCQMLFYELINAGEYEKIIKKITGHPTYGAWSHKLSVVICPRINASEMLSLVTTYNDAGKDSAYKRYSIQTRI